LVLVSGEFHINKDFGCVCVKKLPHQLPTLTHMTPGQPFPDMSGARHCSGEWR
jgi:hypothetical protein